MSEALPSLFQFRTLPTALAVVGSRGYGEDADVRYAMDSSLHGIDMVVSGGARGVDAAAEAYAKELGLARISYRPTKIEGGYGVRAWLNDEDCGLVPHPKYEDRRAWVFPDFRAAAFRRNWWIMRVAGRALALWDGDSTGTAHGIAVATRLGVDVNIWMDGDS